MKTNTFVIRKMQDSTGVSQLIFAKHDVLMN